MCWKWPSKPSILSMDSPRHVYYFSSISHHQTFQKYVAINRNLENRKYENLKILKSYIWKWFTNKCPVIKRRHFFSSVASFPDPPWLNFPKYGFYSLSYHSALAWALVSEPGFWDFQIFRFSIFDILFCCNIFLKSLVVRYRGANNKGVLDRPWTKRRVLRAISSISKFKFTINPES